jgi:hypothetical protein
MPGARGPNHGDRSYFIEGNQAALKHGGAGAELRVRRGEPLVGIAREAELAVYDELEQGGRYALIVRNAARVQSCADLYWNAVSKAAEDQDLEMLDRYVKRFGWLSGVALRAWAQVKAEEAVDDAGAVIVDAIASAREVGGDG